MAKRNQDTSASVKAPITESVTMDSRKFLSVLNNSAQSQVKFFEDAVKQLGSKQGKDWQLAALLNNSLIIEDATNSEYIIADYTRQKGGRIAINNFKKVTINEGEKSPIFESACKSLVDAIESGNIKDIESSFSRITANRFRSKAVPNSGIVRTKDGVVRHISIDKGGIAEDKIQRLSDQIIDTLSSKVQITEGKLVGDFNAAPLKLPVTELSTRRVVAYHMRQRAKNAYWSPNFQTMVESTAALISKGDDESLKKGIDNAAKFLREHQEFTLLTRPQVDELVTNALVIRGVFNESLASDTATLFHRVNLKVNKGDIVDAWRQTAKKTAHPVMLENVSLMEQAQDFEKAHGDFLRTIFENVGETTRVGLLNGLKLLLDRIGKQTEPDNEIQPEPEEDMEVDVPNLGGIGNENPGGTAQPGGKAPELPLEEKQNGDVITEGALDTEAELKELISKLSNPDTADDDTVYGAMQLLSQVNSGMQAMDQKNLDNFDQIPGTEPEMPEVPEEPEAPLPPPAPAAGQPGQANTIININTGSGTPQINTEPATPALAPAPEGGEGDLNDLDLEGTELGEDKQKDAPLTEDEAGALDAVFEEVEPEAEVEITDGDLFVLPEGIEAGKINPDYGMTVLTEYVLDQKVGDLEKLIADRKIPENKVNESIDELAGAVLAGDANLGDPKKMEDAKKELIGAVTQRRLEAERKKAGGTPIGEDQIKSPLKQLKRRGLKKAAINKLVEEGKLQWLKREGDGVLGEYKGIKFVIDHANPPVLMSADGEIELTIPESLVPGALYLAEVKNEEAEADAFVEWLDSNIDQLKNITEEEDKTLDEAIAKITVSPDVKVEVNVDDSGVETLPPTPPVVAEPEVTPVPTPEPTPAPEPEVPVAQEIEDEAQQAEDEAEEAEGEAEEAEEEAEELEDAEGTQESEEEEEKEEKEEGLEEALSKVIEPKKGKKDKGKKKK